MQVGYTDENGDPQCCVPEAYQGRVPQSPTTLSASATLLLLPTGLSVHSQPAASYTAASTTNVAVTLQLLPAVAVISGHPFSVAMASVSESGVPLPAKCIAIILCLLKTNFLFRSFYQQRRSRLKCGLSLPLTLQPISPARSASFNALSGTAFDSSARSTLTVGIVKDAGSSFTINFEAQSSGSTLFNADTNAFTINVASISVTTQPAAAYQYSSGSSTVSPSLTVSLRSSGGDNLDNATPSVSAVLSETSGSLIGGSVASSSQSQSAVSGSVTFTYAVSLEGGDSYRFSVSCMTASVNSNVFAINPFALAVSTQPSAVVQYPNSASSVSTGTAVVELKDGSGNTLTGSSTDSRSMTVTFQEISGAGTVFVHLHIMP